MPEALQDLTVAELERMLDSRKSKLSSLFKKREKVLKELGQIDEDIKGLQGRGGYGLGRKRPRNEKSLRAVVHDVLAANKNGFALDPLSKKVLSSGYQSNSSNFKNVLYQCLYNTKEFIHDEQSGTYRLVSKNGTSKKSRTAK